MVRSRRFALCLFCVAALATATARAGTRATPPKEGCILTTRTVRGEVLDLACYVDSGARGPKHEACARVCIGNGQPVGLLGKDGVTYVIAGRSRPLNAALAKFAGKNVAIRGQVANRDGIHMIENAELLTK